MHQKSNKSRVLENTVVSYHYNVIHSDVHYIYLSGCTTTLQKVPSLSLPPVSLKIKFTQILA